MGKRGPKPNISEEAIMKVAAELVASEGLSALSMSAIARGLDSAVSGLYRYFEGLEAVYVQLQVKAIATYAEQFALSEQRISATLHSYSPRSPKVRALVHLIAVFQTYLKMIESHPVEQSVIDAFISVPAATLTDENALRMNEELQSVFAVCIDALDKAVSLEALLPGDNRQRTQVFWAGLHGLQQFRKRDRILPETLRVKSTEPLLLTSLLIGFGAARPDVEAAFEYLANGKD